MAATIHPKPSRPAPPPPQATNTPIDSTFVTDSRNSQRDIEKDYTLGQQLGLPGQYGHALLATRLSDNQKVAIKVISKLKFNNLRERNVHMSELRTEISILRKLDHPNIIKMFDTYETYSHLYIVTEVCTGGELFDAIKAKGNYNEQDAAHVLQQICSGLAYMHKQGVAHCDLKPDNFLFSDKSPNSALKIIDFGMSKFVKRRHFFRSLRGTPYYIAPEVLQGHYNNSADMWSVGVVMFVMLFGYPPFAADTDDGIFDLISQGFNPVVKKGYKAHFPADLPVSEQAKDLLAKLLTSDVATRLTADEALDHPWLRGEASTQPLVSNVIDNLRQFVGASKLKQKVLDMMATSLDQHELEHLQQQFQHMDLNHDGQITLFELQQSLSNDKISMDNTEVKKLFEAADVDGDGVLNYSELLKISVHRKISAKEERLYNAFRQIDLNRDGRIDAKELESVLQSNHADALQMLKDADVDNDGTIDFDEFANVFEQHSEQLATKQLTALGVQPEAKTPSNQSQNSTDDVSQATQTLSLTGSDSNTNTDKPTHITPNTNNQVTIQQHSPSVTTQSKSSPTSTPQQQASQNHNYQEKNDSKTSGVRRKRSNLDKCTIS